MPEQILKRRYLVSFDTRRLGHIFTDVLVIGSGVAGLRAAIEAAKYGQVIVVTKSRITESNSYYAQGGVAAVFDSADSIEKHIEDTIATCAELGDTEVINRIVTSAPEHIRELEQWGVEFDRADDGGLELGREGGHSENRIVHAHGDATGRAVIDVLVRKVLENENIKVFDKCFAVDLITDPPEGGSGSGCVGAMTWHERYGLQIIGARQTILATGGAGVLWRETSNPPSATAGGMAMMFRAGGAIADPELMQFHPTTLYIAGASRSLVSEAVRGEGALLVDRKGYRFMGDYHDKKELAPRDVVSRAILAQTVKTNFTHVFLDVRHMGEDAFAARFPQIDALCRQFDINPGEDLIPVHPAAHYMIGGAKTDFDGHTNLRNLFACGEAACNGLHGANRLASNSLSEALICGKRSGELAGMSLADPKNGKLVAQTINWQNPSSQRTQLDLADVRNSLRSVMWRNVGIVRRGDRLAETIEIINFWARYTLDKELYGSEGWITQNMLTSAYLIAEAALRRTETRGVHYREDFPNTDPVWARHQTMRRGEHQLIVE